MPEASLAPALLVAMPQLLDPNFHRSVVLLLEHRTEDGTLGIVLNREADMSLGEVYTPDAARHARYLAALERHQRLDERV